MSSYRVAALVVLAAVALSAQPRLSADDAQRLAGIARTAPPELAADVLLRLAGAVPAAARPALIEEAFQLATKAKFPVRMRFATDAFTDSMTGIRHRALEREVDTLSLQVRAVLAMLPMNRARAEKMFESIEPSLPRLTCADSMIAQPDVYYDAAARVYRGNEHRQVVERVLQRVTSPTELAPAARMIGAQKLPAGELREMVGVYASVLARVRGDDRSFVVTIKDVFDAVRDLEAGGWVQLMSAFRSYVVWHARGVRCGGSDESELNSVISRFNVLVRDQGQNAIAQISVEEATPASRGEKSARDVRPKSWKGVAGLEFLADTTLLEQEPPVWLFFATELLKGPREKAIDALAASGHSVLMLYDELASRGLLSQQ